MHDIIQLWGMCIIGKEEEKHQIEKKIIKKALKLDTLNKKHDDNSLYNGCSEGLLDRQLQT